MKILTDLEAVQNTNNNTYEQNNKDDNLVKNRVKHQATCYLFAARKTYISL